MTRNLFDFLKKWDVEFYRSLDISNISSIGIGAVCDTALYPHSVEQFLKAVDFLEENSVKYFVAGRMTNVLVCCEKYDGVILFTTKIKGYYVAENVVSAECGASFSSILKEISSLSLGGYEQLYGIPGSVGGMVYNNAGAFGKSVSDCFVRAKLYSPRDKTVTVASASEMGFSYRKSVLQNKTHVLLSADFLFAKKDEEEIQEAFTSVIIARKKSQPYGSKSLGSVFKRQDGVPLSKLIDDIGLKGVRIGGAEISKKHAGFIVNAGGATSDDVLRLIELIKTRLYKECGVIAEEEIEFLK